MYISFHLYKRPRIGGLELVEESGMGPWRKTAKNVELLWRMKKY
jgi:hypothetical protein